MFLFISGRVYAVEKGLLIEKFKEDMDFLQAVMSWLQKIDEELKDQKVCCNVLCLTDSFYFFLFYKTL